MLTIFERLDEQRITIRDGDERILRPSAEQATVETRAEEN
jgi:hypothetical protein